MERVRLFCEYKPISALQLTDYAAWLLFNSPKEFERKYGTHYVNEYQTGVSV
jgi:hypothetical protein